MSENKVTKRENNIDQNISINVIDTIKYLDKVCSLERVRYERQQMLLNADRMKRDAIRSIDYENKRKIYKPRTLENRYTKFFLSSMLILLFCIPIGLSISAAPSFWIIFLSLTAILFFIGFYHKIEYDEEMDKELSKEKEDLKSRDKKISIEKKKVEYYNSVINEHRKALRTLDIQLKNIYSKNILHPNYQNWIAAATIREYLDVGRCNTLKGTFGAYNIFEAELMANKIANTISDLQKRVTNISSSQVRLKQEIQECNSKINNLLR